MPGLGRVRGELLNHGRLDDSDALLALIRHPEPAAPAKSRCYSRSGEEQRHLAPMCRSVDSPRCSENNYRRGLSIRNPALACFHDLRLATLRRPMCGGVNMQPCCLLDAANVDSFQPLLAGRADLRRYIVLMGAMVAEGARMKSTRLEFADLYDGKSVAIDEGRVKNYGKARAIMALADERRIDRATFVAKLHPLRALIDASRALSEVKTGSPVHPHSFITWVNGTRNPALDNVKGIDKARIRQIIDDLALNTEQATDMLTKIADADVGRNVDELAKRAGKTS